MCNIDLKVVIKYNLYVNVTINVSVDENWGSATIKGSN